MKMVRKVEKNPLVNEKIQQSHSLDLGFLYFLRFSAISAAFLGRTISVA